MRTISLSARWIAPVLGALLPLVAQADSPTFSNLLPGDYDSLVKEFSGNFTYSSVTPASSLGGLGGFEFGVVGGVTKDPSLVSLVKTASPSTNMPAYLPHAAILGRLGLPFGFTAEAMIFPKRTVSSLTLSDYGGAIMWTATDAVLEDLPLDLAAKFSIAKATLSYTQNTTVSATVNGFTAGATIPVTVEYANTEWALQAIASKKLFVFEPFVGLGYVNSKGALDISAGGAAVSILSSAGFGAAATHAESKPKSIQLIAGTDIRLAFFSLGAEFQSSFGTQTYTGRVSFRF